MKNPPTRSIRFIAAILFLINFQLCAQQHAPDIITPTPHVPPNLEQPNIHPERLEGALIMPLSSQITPHAVLKAMQRVADWQLANLRPTRPPAGFRRRATRVSWRWREFPATPKYRDAMLAMGGTNNWKLGAQFYDADDHCIGQTWAELYFLYRENKMVAPLREKFDAILAKPSESAEPRIRQAEEPKARENWSWCDSLFMGPPTWVRLYAATDDPRYLDFAVTNWWRTTDYLYDKDEHLFFRDSTFFKKPRRTGKKFSGVAATAG